MLEHLGFGELQSRLKLFDRKGLLFLLGFAAGLRTAVAFAAGDFLLFGGAGFLRLLFFLFRHDKIPDSKG